MFEGAQLGLLYCIPCIMADLHSLHWTGKLYIMPSEVKQHTRNQIRFFSKWLTRLGEFAPFRIQ
jgi:hypothetical protein